MYKGQAIVDLAEKQLGTRGTAAKSYCGLPSNANYCDAFVSWLFYKENCRDLFCDGKKQTYCPTSIKLVRKQMPMLPIYLGLPGDVIFFDWEPNGDPNHIGIVRSRVSDLEIDTVEGNTSGYGTTGVVANKTRPYFIPETKRVQIQGMFRPQFAVDESEFDASKKLTVDGLFGFNSIACLQKALKKLGYYSGAIDAIMGLNTVKGIQKAAGVEADGSWGPNTTKAVQKMVDAKVDGFFGPASVKALQIWINKQNSVQQPKSNAQKIADKASELAYAGFPKEAKYPSGHAKEAYKKALDAVYPSRSSWGKAARLGASCDVYVGTCVRASGVDSSFPRGLSEQLPHMIKSDKFTEIAYKKENLRAGDIVIYKRKRAGQHIFIVKNSTLHICEANHESTYGITRTTTRAINYKLKTSNKAWIRIFRAR